MSDYVISPVYPSDTRTNAQVNALLEQEGIRPGCQFGLYLCLTRITTP